MDVYSWKKTSINIISIIQDLKTVDFQVPFLITENQTQPHLFARTPLLTTSYYEVAVGSPSHPVCIPKSWLTHSTSVFLLSKVCISSVLTPLIWRNTKTQIYPKLNMVRHICFSQRACPITPSPLCLPT